MSQVQDKRIYELMIPGTHDSGTEGFPPLSPSRTQYYTIDEQLNGGVRFLDMRLAWNGAENNFHVVHAGDVLSYLNFDTVVEWCDAFLVAHPTETILMSIKQEGAFPGGDDAFAQELSRWNTANAQSGKWRADLWYVDSSTMPTVTTVKSKIVLLRRYSPTPTPGVPFSMGFDLTFINGSQRGSAGLVPGSAQSPAVDLSLQDEYEAAPEDKKGFLDSYLSQMESNFVPGPNNMSWTLNFASSANGGGLLPGPLYAANAINPWLTARLGQVSGKLYGVLLTDYADRALWQQIYEFSLR